MHAQNAAESRRRRRAGLSVRAPPPPRSASSPCTTTLPAGDRAAEAADAGLSTMTAAEGAWLRHERADDGSELARGEKRSSSCSGAAALGVVAADRPLRSRLFNGSSQMRPDEPCRRNDTDDLCSLDIDRSTAGQGEKMQRSLSCLDGSGSGSTERRLLGRTRRLALYTAPGLDDDALAADVALLVGPNIGGRLARKSRVVVGGRGVERHVSNESNTNHMLCLSKLFLFQSSRPSLARVWFGLDS